MIVGLTGKKGAGKDTVGSYLVEQYGFRRVSFADPLKESVAALLDITREQIEQWKNDPHAVVTVGIGIEDGWTVGKTIPFRTFLQRYGTEAHRDVFGKDFWVDQGAAALIATASQGPVVVTDVRFDNEAATIRALGGSVVRVYRPEAEHSTDDHASEQLPQADYALVNTGTFEYLYDQVRRYVIGGKRNTPSCCVPGDPWAGCCGFSS